MKSSQMPSHFMTGPRSCCRSSGHGCEAITSHRSPRKRPRDSTARAASSEQERRLKKAATQYAEAVKKGVAEDDFVAMQLGAQDVSELSERQQAYVDKIKAKLAKEAEEEQKRKEQNSRLFTQGKAAYSTGQYEASAVLFKEALDTEGDFSPLGGEIQLWLALAYQACGREQDCIDMYKSIEKNHPIPRVKRQAAELRFIMEAPKLKIGPDERVKLPILEDQSRYVKQRGPTYRSSPRPPPMSRSRKTPKTFEEEFWETYKPPLPELVKNRYFLVASGVLATGLAWYSAVLSRALLTE